jgi:tetratricopeptide (TPR) repeat protein
MTSMPALPKDTPIVSRSERPALFASPEKRQLVLSLALATIVLLLYAQTNRFFFVNFDDGMYVIQNSHVRAGLTWSTLAWAMTSTYGNWHPVTWISHALDCQLFGINPAGHHFVSVLLHALNAVLLFLLLARVTGRMGASFFVAALFAVHPLKNILSTTFFLLTLGAYGWYVLKPGWKRYLVVALFFALGLASKSMLVTLPFVLLLIDYWPLYRVRDSRTNSQTHGRAGASQSSAWALALEKLPLLVLSAADSAITILAQRQAGAITSSARFPFTIRLENAIYSYAVYLGKAFWPRSLASMYPYPGSSLPTWKIALAAALLTIATAAFIKFRSRRYLIVGWLFFLGTLVPVIGLVQVGDQARADRYVYLPLLGIFVIAVWAAADFGAWKKINRHVLRLAGTVVLLALCIVTYRQIGYWKDSVTLWSHTLAVTEDNFAAEDDMGLALIQADRPDEAFPHFERAASLAPNDPVSHANIGTYFHQHGRLQDAIEQYEIALRLTNNAALLVDIYTNLGSAYRQLGNHARSEESFDHALQLDSSRCNVWLGIGHLALDEKRFDDAIRDFSQSVELQPTLEGYLQLGRALALVNRRSEALTAYQQALKLSPNSEKAERAVASLSTGP